ncbi:MAG: hypothetical protein JNK29_06485 [Anaerolineales bacterium]|nr:hypothetical protein [Anaerolineales bacterium]
MENLRPWNQRWHALDTMIDQTEKALPSGFSQEERVRALLRGLRAFGASQVQYFLANRSPVAREFPEAAVLGQTLTQIAADLELIERLAHQRAWGPLAGQQALAQADCWLTQILRSADPWLPERDQLFTTLASLPGLRHLPYLGVVVMSLPYTCLGGDEDGLVRDWLEALPALGRHLFRRGWAGAEPLAEAVRRRAGDLAAWSEPWLEPVFAEVFAGLTAGPAAALAAQDAALALAPAQFNLAATPAGLPPCLAPKIHLRLLERLALDDWAESLGQRWHTRLRQRGAPATVRLAGPITEIRLTHPRDELDALTDAAYDELQAQAAGPRTGWHSRYSQLNAYAPHTLDTLYTDFAAGLEPAPPAFPPPPRTAGNWPARFIAADRQARLALAPAGLADDVHDWLAVLRADGWLAWPV